jgi:hypothetical protein
MRSANVGQIVTIAARFNGPPGIGNGGYVAGLLAARIGGPASVTLRRPTPLGRALAVVSDEDGGLVLRDEQGPIALAKRVVPPAIDMPAPPPYELAAAASGRFGGLFEPLFSGCFVCGPGRAAGDGLRIMPGPLEDAGRRAAVWVPGPDLADEHGRVRPEFVWAALDCPGKIAVLRGQPRPILLGRLTVSLEAAVRAGERLIVLGWTIADEGRKHHAGTALFAADGTRRAVGYATWLDVAALAAPAAA